MQVLSNSCLFWFVLVAPAIASSPRSLDDPIEWSSDPKLTLRDTFAVPRPILGSVPYGIILNNCRDPGIVALTFDDGPSQFTTTLLDMLKAASVPATFFITGANNGKGAIDDPSTGWGDVIRRTYAEGHQVASHTWTHPYLDNISSAERVREMTRNEQAFTNILGFFPTYMRPPYTFCSAASGCLADMTKLGYHLINLNLDTEDWQNQSPQLIVNSENTVEAALDNGNVATSQFLLLEHDTHEQTVKALVPFIIKGVRAKGYKFARVGECMNDPPSNWYRNATSGQAENSPLASSQNPVGSIVQTVASSAFSISGTVLPGSVPLSTPSSLSISPSSIPKITISPVKASFAMPTPTPSEPLSLTNPPINVSPSSTSHSNSASRSTARLRHLLFSVLLYFFA